MKKTISILSTLLILMCAAQTFAFADIVDPLPPPEKTGSILPMLLIAFAIIVVTVVLWGVRRQKK